MSPCNVKRAEMFQLPAQFDLGVLKIQAARKQPNNNNNNCSIYFLFINDSFRGSNLTNKVIVNKVERMWKKAFMA